MNKLLCQLYETNIALLEIARDMTIENDMLDSQEFLDYQDALNKLSLDPDRKSTSLK